MVLNIMAVYATGSRISQSIFYKHALEKHITCVHLETKQWHWYVL